MYQSNRMHLEETLSRVVGKKIKYIVQFTGCNKLYIASPPKKKCLFDWLGMLSFDNITQIFSSAIDEQLIC